MKESTATALGVSVVALAIAGFLSVWVYFATQANVEQAKDATIRITACIDSGGTWMERYGDCIQ